ncbi:WD repeat-containing protein 74 [Astyanax mexicanus]|uniref:WD repeat-containing protein 74 n=1 Tax=Astyanax mexicanus TaxID=7994 RepID=A0A8B9JZQ2_ASTMX|nr:WD repeat-containing protein 74 [Astyanax mexicanus]KAG9263232.1 WD repeat-containing protein 74 [Astyanax mexicanus]
MANQSQLCSVWVGSETGILKGVSLSKKRAFNFCDMSSISREHGICALAWGDENESEVLVGCVNGTVKTFSIEKGIFIDSRSCGDFSQGQFTGIAVTPSSLITCVESGLLSVWTEGSTDKLEINVGKGVCRMRQNPARRNCVATGGKENPLKVWDLERPDKALFTAKNVANDWLDLRVPVWVRDMAFIPDSEKIVTCTGYHQVRVYDPLTPQRRPVLEAEFGEYPLTALSLPAGHDRVVVGNTHGQIAILDLRKGLVRGCVKGLAGSVRGLECHASSPLLASCGLDRFLRIHSLEDRSTRHKVYLKSQLNCVLLSSKDLELLREVDTGEVEDVNEKEIDEVWDVMETVSEKGDKRAVLEEEEEDSEETVETKDKKKKRRKTKK